MPLPLPETWSRPRRKPWLPSQLAFGLAAVWAVGGLFPALNDGHPADGLVGGLFWACIGVVCAPRTRGGVETRDGALVLAASRLRVVAMYVAAAFFPLAWLSPLGLVAALALWAVGTVHVMFHRGGGSLVLDRDGVTYDVWRSRVRRSWDDLGMLTAEKDRLFADGLGEVRAERLTVDPLTAYWTLHYYATHPGSRDELADGRAVERVRRGDLLPEPAMAGRP